MANLVTFTGISGQQYRYQVCQRNVAWRAVPGNYIFAHQVDGEWVVDYVGETSDLSTRFGAHHKLALAFTDSATHILAHINNGGDAARRAEEEDLIAAYQPRHNQQDLAPRMPPSLHGLFGRRAVA